MTDAELLKSILEDLQICRELIVSEYSWTEEINKLTNGLEVLFSRYNALLQQQVILAKSMCL